MPQFKTATLALTLAVIASTAHAAEPAAPVSSVFQDDIRNVSIASDTQPAEIKLLADESPSQDIDLRGMAAWALNYLIHNPRKHLDYECRFNVFPLHCPPTVLGHDPVTFGDTDVRMDWEFIYMRDICGREEGLDVQRALRKHILGYADERGLIGFPFGAGEIGFEAFKKLPADKDIPFKVGGSNLPSFWSTAKTMVGLAETYQRTGDEADLVQARKMFATLKEMSHWEAGRATYSADEILGGNFVEAIVRYWELTKDPEALALARGFAEAIVASGMINDDGSHGGHGHTTTHIVWGVAHLGQLLGQPRFVDWARGVFDFVSSWGTDYGWMPAAFGDKETLRFCETCSTSDMVSIACCLGQAGRPEYFGHAERYVRNYIREIQFFITPEYIAYYHKLNPDKPDEVEEGIEMMREMEGGFLGTMAANDLVSYVPSDKYGGGEDYMLLWGCCSPEGMRTLWTVWTNAVTETDEGVFVNMHFNRDAPQAKVVSFQPDGGRLTVQARQDSDFFLRPPAWTVRSEVRAYRNGQAVDTAWAGPANAYIHFAAAKTDDELTITYPLVKFTQDIHLGKEPMTMDFTIEWLGNTVQGISPPGHCMPMFANVPRPLPDHKPLYQLRP